MGKPLTEHQASEILDTSGLLCPLPVIKTAELAKRLPAGTILKVLSTDAGVDPDLRNWCRSLRHEFIACSQEGEVYHVLIRI